MEESNKRKVAPAGGAQQPQHKKKKAGNAGKWKTSHKQAQAGHGQDRSVHLGDAGIWVTCARRQEKKAVAELTGLLEEYASLMYGVNKKAESGVDEGHDPDDIESAIKKEVDALNSKGGPSHDRPFTAATLNVDCLAFLKTTKPIEPALLVKRVCLDAQLCSDPKKIRVRYVNRLSPSTLVGRASESGILETANQILAPYFDLSGKRTKTGSEQLAHVDSGPDLGQEVADSGASKGSKGAPGTQAVPAKASDEARSEAGEAQDEAAGPGEAKERERKPYSFAIRPSLRNYTTLTSRQVINLVAGLINHERHQVNLMSPDKVILVDIYQNVCGMSVVDGDWDELKRYNMTELYNEATGRIKPAQKQATR